MNYYLIHRGVSILGGAPGIGSGRYPLGFGDRPYQRMKNKAKKVAIGALKFAGGVAASTVISYATGNLLNAGTIAAVTSLVNMHPSP